MRKIFKAIISAGIMISIFPAALANTSKIEQIFSYDTIGVDVAYIESIIGIARKTDTHYKTKNYVIDGCDLVVGYNEQSVETMTVNLTDHCRFNLKDIISYNETIPSDQVVFGLTGPVTYYADCLMMCGNAYDPSVYELHQGSRAENFRELLLGSANSDYEATSKWRDTMIAQQGEDWVLDNRYNCEPQKYSDIAAGALKGQPVDQITIGYNLESRQQLQFGCDETVTAATPVPVKHNEGVQAIPFQVAYQEGDYTYYLGSQVLEGEIFYEPNDMFGHWILFTPDLKSSKQIGLEPNSSFVLNEYSQMNIESLIGAGYYLDFNVNFEDPKFQNSYCTIKGKAKLQIIGISLYLPEESEPHVYMRSLKNMGSGPFKVSCQ